MWIAGGEIALRAPRGVENGPFRGPIALKWGWPITKIIPTVMSVAMVVMLREFRSTMELESARY